MPSPATNDEFLELLRRSGLADAQHLDAALERLHGRAFPPSPKALAVALIEEGVLTYFQAEQLLRGKWRGFSVGKYQILERIGSGGMGLVYLGEHKLMRRRVAIKVLPVDLAQEQWFLQQFYREAQAVASLDHPNIVRAHDVDHDGPLHFLVMEYVDGSSLHHIVAKFGPLALTRAAHYISQAANGLQHAHDMGLVHRDIKPGNLLLSRQGVVKILDLGLARLFQDRQVEAARNREKRMVGTDDYLAPEQIVDSDDVDGRADIYSLGATFYYLLTGQAPFQDAALDHHKLMWHVMRSPKAVREIRPDVPEAMAAVVARMMAKNPWDRYQKPEEVVEALAPWTGKRIPPPPAAEMPELSLAARRSADVATSLSDAARSQGKSSWVITGVTQGSTARSGFLSGATRPPEETPAPANRPAGDGRS
jgi:serine/threonine protein kinase